MNTILSLTPQTAGQPRPMRT